MKSMIKRIVFFGECMVEHNADGVTAFGGDTFNTAWYLAQLLRQVKHDEITVSYATALGTDGASADLTAMLSAAHINQDYIIVTPESRLGEYWISLDNNGERRFTFARDKSPVKAYFNRDQRLIQALQDKQVDAIYLSGVSLAILCDSQRRCLFQALAMFKEAGGMIFFDNNYRQALWPSSEAKQSYLALMPLVDIAFLTDEDEYAVYGTQGVNDIISLHQQRSMQPQILVIRQGAKPCLLVSSNDTPVIYIAAQHIKPAFILDTCGAGDAFAGGFMAQWLLGTELRSAARFAHRVAAKVIQHHGALIPEHLLPSLETQECHYENAL
ncbi:sugar kinase [Pseudoalteromonas sp. McH1-7]|uniref:sugar kinase n=1 Tax=Pseudoalteromonas sp. McH1-7 TaxID=2745574 RepID=UPI001591255C|nr:sugar kinase [Pseudoalteromonas sp. McH1-7]NUZ10980.1 sugar kinase [Pseudoalteromonas sp. McH1-7]